MPMAVEDAAGRVVLWTAGIADLLAWPDNAVLGRGIPFVDGRDVATFDALRERARAGHRTETANTRVRTATGALLRVRARADPAMTGADDNPGVVWSLSPSTPDQDLQRTLADRDQYCTDLLEATPVPTFVKNAAGEYVAVNTAWEQFFGRTRERWLGRTVQEMKPEAVARMHAVQDAELRRRGGSMQWEAVIESVRGEQSPVIYRKTAFRDAEGHFAGIIGSIVDIADLRRAESRFREVVEMAPGALVMTDQEGVIALVNQQAERLFGYDRRELIGHSIEVLVPERQRDDHPLTATRLSEHSSGRTGGKGHELFARRKDGSEIPVEIGLESVPSEHGTTVVAIVLDISERRAAQQRIETALAEKTVLLGEVHHRVKNNLQVVSSLLSLQASRSANATVQSALRSSHSRVRAMGLVHELLYERGDFSRIGLDAYLRRLVKLVSSTAQIDPHHIRIDLDLDAGAVEMGQAMYSGLIVNELVCNAISHAFPGDRHGRVQVEAKAVDEDLVRVRVSDDGVGLRGIEARSTGTLGLRLVVQLAEQIGGRLGIGEEPGGGTRVEIEFPAAVRQQPHAERRHTRR